VKSKVRDLRGILYLRSGGESGGHSVAWDFFNDPSVDAPTVTPDHVPFAGTQVQILLPHRTSRYTFIEYHRPLMARRGRELEPRETLIPAAPGELDLANQIATLPDHTVLFVDMSQMDENRWKRADVDEIGRQLLEGFASRNSRVWLLNPSETIVQELRASSFVVDLWRDAALLLPYVKLADPDKPPQVSFITKDATLRSTDPGDTAEARLRLVELISLLVGHGEEISIDRLDDLQPDERSWAVNALGTNHSLVDPLRDDRGIFTAAVDIERLGRRAVASLLGKVLRLEIERKVSAQSKARPMWFRLPSQVYCRSYINPRLFSELNPSTRDALERWIEERIAETRASYAISYTNFAVEMLTRAKRGGVTNTLPPLRHYSYEYVREQLKDIPPGSHVVLLAAISGSGKTIVDTVRLLSERNITTSVVAIVDTTTAAERHGVLADLERRGEFHYRTRWEIEKFREIPANQRHIPIAIIDPETLLPVMQAPELPTRLRDGHFWHILATSRGLSVGAITYKGIDYTTMIHLRNVLKHPDIEKLLIEDFSGCFADEPGSPLGPDIVCCTKETMAVLSIELLRSLKHRFPKTDFITEDRLERPSSTTKSRKKLEGQHVVIFAAAATSGAGVARLQRYFQTAKRVHLCMFISRIPDGLMMALTGAGRRVSLTTFQRLVSGSPELRLGSSRSIALPALQDYRASCLSNRLLLFVDKLRRDLTDPPVMAAQSPDELESVVHPEPQPAQLRFEMDAVYKFGTAAGLESLRRLVRQCRKEDQKWLYGILDEVASRAEAALRNYERDSKEWQRTYIDDMAHLYREAPGTEDVSARKTILEALLLHRWRWAEGRDRAHTEVDPDAVEEEAEWHDEMSSAFAREMLGDMWRAPDPDFRAVVIRAISKIDRNLLIGSLDEIIELARHCRATELTLALELTKVLDDIKSAGRLLERLTNIVRDRARRRPAGRDEPFDVALDDLLSDIGLGIAEENGDPVVTFLPWSRVAAILESEPPDHDRTIRLLIRAMRGLFGPHARLLYYLEQSPGDYTYGDAWPLRSPGDKRRIPEANTRAIALLGDSNFFFAPRLGGDKLTEQYLSKLTKAEARKFTRWGMALFRMRLPRGFGLLRVWQNVELHGSIDGAAVEEMRSAVEKAEELIARRPSAVRVIGDWQYEQMIGGLAGRTSDPGNTDPVIHFAEVLREILGGDVASLLTLDESEKEWTRVYLGGRGRSHPLKFSSTDPKRLTNYVAEHRRGCIFRDVEAAAAAGFVQRPAVDWAEAWFALPLVHSQSELCRAVVHIWHHIPGWFEDAAVLLPALQSLGGTVVELNAAYNMARIVREAALGGAVLDLNAVYHLAQTAPQRSRPSGTSRLTPASKSAMPEPAQKAGQLVVFDRDEIDRLGSRLVNLTLASDGLLSKIARGEATLDAIESLRRSIQQTQENVAELVHNLQVPETDSVVLSFAELVKTAVAEAERTYGKGLFSDHVRLPYVEIRKRMMQRAIEELLKNAKAHLQPGQKVRVELMHDDDAIILAVHNPGYGIPAEAKDKVFTMGTGLLLAKAAAERHGGRLEEVGEPGEGAVFRMVLPVSVS